MNMNVYRVFTYFIFISGLMYLYIACFLVTDLKINILIPNVFLSTFNFLDGSLILFTF